MIVMNKLKANVCAITYSGQGVTQNNDNINLNGMLTATGDLRKGSAYVQNLFEPFYFAVSDGIGADAIAGVASDITTKTVSAHAEQVVSGTMDTYRALNNCMNDANSRICNESANLNDRIGATVATVYAFKGRLIAANVGNTRIYRYSNGVLSRLSVDHTQAQLMIDMGEATDESVRNTPDANRLTRLLGIYPEEGTCEPNIQVVEDLDDNDIILVCSDGLTNYVSDAVIAEILGECKSSQDVCSKLVKKAIVGGGNDNISVVVATIGLERTATFAPLAATAGDTDPDYEEEYATSYKENTSYTELERTVDPSATQTEDYYGNKKKKYVMLIIIACTSATCAPPSSARA